VCDWLHAGLLPTASRTEILCRRVTSTFRAISCLYFSEPLLKLSKMSICVVSRGLVPLLLTAAVLSSSACCTGCVRK
jgi:hypothetical protein